MLATGQPQLLSCGLKPLRGTRGETSVDLSVVGSCCHNAGVAQQSTPQCKGPLKMLLQPGTDISKKDIKYMQLGSHVHTKQKTKQNTKIGSNCWKSQLKYTVLVTKGESLILGLLRTRDRFSKC